MTLGEVFIAGMTVGGSLVCLVQSRRRNGYWGLDLDGRHRRWIAAKRFGGD